MGAVIVLAGMLAWVLIVAFSSGTPDENLKQEGGSMNKFYERGEVIDVGKKFTDMELATPYGVSEKSL